LADDGDGGLLRLEVGDSVLRLAETGPTDSRIDPLCGEEPLTPQPFLTPPPLRAAYG
jgi:hypothetical protein